MVLLFHKFTHNDQQPKYEAIKLVILKVRELLAFILTGEVKIYNLSKTSDESFISPRLSSP